MIVQRGIVDSGIMRTLAMTHSNAGGGLPPGPSSGSNITAIRLKHLRILVVDDESLFRKGVVLNLSAVYGSDVVEECAGLPAVRLSEQDRRFDLILMDIVMPGPMSGIDACVAMRDAGVRVPIVLMSAYATDEHRGQAKALGIQILGKPIDYELFEKIILQCGGENAS